jgi:2-polyprenyl-3-methyl-5-hydroxy-6-metoxy-1,4-benzoquinol methylase/uncharacterized protein YbaR (Trm112 family)
MTTLLPERWQLFRCPACKGELTPALSQAPGMLAGDEGMASLKGRLSCGQCGAAYPVHNSIPRFVADSGYSGSFGFQWNLHRRTQLDSYSGMPVSLERLFGTTGWPRDLTGEIVLEAGSGAGRFTEILLGAGAHVYSFDYSEAVDANRTNNGAHPNLTLFQASIFAIPLPRAAFGRVICLGVIQHTPDPAACFRKLAEMVRPGGVLVMDVYAKSWIAALHWKYLLRPITKRMDKATLYRTVAAITPRLIPFARWMRRIAGRAGARMVPILEYSHLGLSPELNREWAILDTFDMYSPAHDHPQSESTVRGWYETAGFVDITVRRGQNGVIARGRRA